MDTSAEQHTGRWDAAYVPIALLVMGYVGAFFGVTVWGIVGLACTVLGGFLAYAIWHGDNVRGRVVSPATSFALWMLKYWVLWVLAIKAFLR